MTIICSWCKKVLGEKPPRSDASITHSICAQCQKKLMAGNRPQNKNLSRTHLKKGSPEAKAWGERMRAMRGKRKRSNPKGGYSGTLKLPTYIDRAVAMVLHDGPRVLDWEWDRRMSPENKKHFHDFLVSVHHPLAYEAGTPEQRFKRFILEYVMPYIEKNPPRNRARRNPGAAWHAQKRKESHSFDTQMRRGKKPTLAMFYHGKEVAHSESEMKARELGMNPSASRRWVLWDRHLSKTSYGNFTTKQQVLSLYDTLNREFPGRYEIMTRKAASLKEMQRAHTRNPLAVYGLGNPKKRRIPSRVNGRVNTSVAGILYHRCLEVRAEKTVGGPGFTPGLYRHPFARNSGVQILALDNGDLLLHSTRGKRLWGTEQS